MRNVSFAVTQFACLWDRRANVAKAKELVRAAALGRFARTLGTLVKSGVSLLPALKIVEIDRSTLAMLGKPSSLTVFRKEWNGEKQVHVFGALRGLAEGYAAEPKVEFLGINDDKAEQVEAAKKLAAEKGYKWAQLYEASAGAAALTEPAFHVAASPWDVIIDGDGNVRAVGTASEPEFQYALRAAAVEAKGEYTAVAPRTIEGVAAARAAGEAPAVEAEKKGEKKKKEKEEQAKPEPEPPHNEEAAKLLDQARLYLKTGKKTEAKRLLQELIEKYPNTWEAQEAKRLGIV